MVFILTQIKNKLLSLPEKQKRIVRKAIVNICEINNAVFEKML